MFAKKIGVDLGSTGLRVAARGEDDITEEPSAVAVRRLDGRVVAVGAAAFEAYRLEPNGVRMVLPLREGRLFEPGLAEGMLRHLVARAQGRQRLFKPEVLVCVPSWSTGLERRSLVDAAVAAGARQAWLLEMPLAVAMGAGVRIAEPRPRAVCDIGAQKAELAIVADSGLMAVQRVPGGGQLDAAIAAHVRRRHGVALDEDAAEALKLAVGAAEPLPQPLATEVTGRAAAGHGVVRIGSGEVAEAIREPLAALAGAVLELLQQLTTRQARQVLRDGLILAGGGALLRGLTQYLAGETGVRAHVVDDPRRCAIRGARRALGEFEVLRRRQLYLH